MVHSSHRLKYRVENEHEGETLLRIVKAALRGMEVHEAIAIICRDGMALSIGFLDFLQLL